MGGLRLGNVSYSMERGFVNLNGAVCESCVRPEILHESGALCLKESDIGIL